MSVLIMQAALLARSGKRPIDPDAQALFDAFTGTPSEKLKTAISNYIVKLKNPALWDSGRGALWYGTHSFCCPQGIGSNEHDRLLDWRNPSRSAVNNFTANGGANESLGFYQNANPTHTSGQPPIGTPAVDDFSGPYKQNDCAVSIYVSRAGAVNNSGVWTGARQPTIMQLRATTGATYRLYGWVQSSSQATGVNTGGVEPQAGDEITLSRVSATNARILQNGVSGAVSTGTSSSTIPGTIGILCSYSGGWQNSDTQGAVGRSYVGRHLTAAENAMLRQIHNEYLAELGM